MGNIVITVDKREIYRYLGYSRNIPDPEICRRVDQCLEELQEVVTPRKIHRIYALEYTREASVFRIAGTEIHSRDLATNLRGCESVCLMAATIGIGPDRLIARASVIQMSRAVVLQAAAAAMIETWCDEVSREIAEEAAAKGLYCRPRFSPGYGDFAIDHQRDFAQILKMQKEIGVSLTESLQMMPSKSVTAVIGLSRTEEHCVPQGCETCDKSPACVYKTAGSSE